MSPVFYFFGNNLVRRNRFTGTFFRFFGENQYCRCEARLTENVCMVLNDFWIPITIWNSDFTGSGTAYTGNADSDWTLHVTPRQKNATNANASPAIAAAPA